jgi:toluene monooxygenase system protein D
VAVSGSARLVGPVIRGVDREVADALIEAIEIDNPGADVMVEDRGGYVRIACPARCVVTRRSLESALGTEFRLAELERALAGFAGRMRFEGDDAVVWYLERED